VSTDGGALPEVVGQTGNLVPAGDPKALEEAIGRLLQTGSAERERQGQAGRQHILTHFAWQRAAREMAQLYQKVIAANTRTLR
jgi:glycosyltransferase involved in cell wall biosynthesis